jgi:hypothetical protein
MNARLEYYTSEEVSTFRRFAIDLIIYQIPQASTYPRLFLLSFDQPRLRKPKPLSKVQFQRMRRARFVRGRVHSEMTLALREEER